MLKNSDLYILDEPTNSLDVYSEKELFDLLINNLKEKTILFITHKLTSVINVDRILYIENGQIVENGSHQELIEKHGKYYKMFKTQYSLLYGGE